MEKYFENIQLLENTLLPYFCEEYPLKLINKKFNILNHEKYNTYIQPHGIHETYRVKNKIPYHTKTYRNGELDGLYKEYSIDGKLKIRSSYKNGMLNGLYESWFENGQLRERCNYVNDGINGIYERYWMNGNLKIKYECEYGIRNGVYQEYHYRGILKKEICYTINNDRCIIL